MCVCACMLALSTSWVLFNWVGCKLKMSADDDFDDDDDHDEDDCEEVGFRK